ncbi:GNAT family N-acetyltransferase [Tenacibaculum ascidiaceicola]|uniref:GNAT family N-acetyltransferase n=1 Tax=Tenacibaculum ascidiaceicola TaxID=1699411 RepID=UPI0039E939CD
MEFKEVSKLSPLYKEQVRLLWNREYPHVIEQKSIEDFNQYLESLKNKNHLLVIENNRVLGWCCDFIREDECWFAMILDKEIQGKRIGRRLIEKLKKRHKKLNGWVVIGESYLKENKETYKSPIGFYKKLGFTVFEKEKLDSSILNAVKIQLKS